MFQIPFSSCARPKRGHLFPGGIKAIFLQISCINMIHLNLSHPSQSLVIFPLDLCDLQLSFQYQNLPGTLDRGRVSASIPAKSQFFLSFRGSRFGKPTFGGTMGVEKKPKQKMAKAVEKKRPDKRTFVFSESSSSLAHWLIACFSPDLTTRSAIQLLR